MSNSNSRRVYVEVENEKGCTIRATVFYTEGLDDHRIVLFDPTVELTEELESEIYESAAYSTN